MNSIVKVETLNGTEFVNLDTVRRFVLGTDGALELRFGNAETLVLTGNSAQHVLQWVESRVQTCTTKTQQLCPKSVPATTVERQPEGTAKPQRRVQLMPLSADQNNVPTMLTTAPPIPNSTADSETTARPPSPTIDRQNWLH